MVAEMKKPTTYLQHALLARKQGGVSVLRQLAEILQLRYSESELGFSEYYTYRLFDRDDQLARCCWLNFARSPTSNGGMTSLE